MGSPIIFRSLCSPPTLAETFPRGHGPCSQRVGREAGIGEAVGTMPTGRPRQVIPGQLNGEAGGQVGKKTASEKECTAAAARTPRSETAHSVGSAGAQARAGRASWKPRASLESCLRTAHRAERAGAPAPTQARRTFDRRSGPTARAQRRGTCEHLGARAGRRGTSVREHGVELVGAPRREWRTGSAGAPMQEQRITARTGAPARARVVRTAPHRVSWRSGAEDCLVESAQAQSAMGPQPRTAGNAWVRSSPAAPFGFQGARPKNKSISKIRPLGVFPRAC
jgi:hypothetical protein